MATPPPVLTRQEATNDEIPQLQKRLEALTGRNVVVICIVADEDGISIVGNSTPEGVVHYLGVALTEALTSQPTQEWDPDLNPNQTRKM